MLWKLLREAVQRRAAGRLVSRGLALRRQGRLPDAEQVLRRAVAKFPQDAIAATNLAIVLLEQDQGQQGVALLQQALASDPQCGAAHYNLANILRASGRFDEAITHYSAASRSVPQIAPAGEELMHTLLEVCDWDRAQVEADKLCTLVAARPAEEWMRCISPLTSSYLQLDSAQRKQVARYHAAECARGTQPVRRRDLSRDNEATRMRIGYLSRDFRDHPVGHLLRGALDLHNRSRFEVFAFSYGPDDGSAYRTAIAAGADHFVNIAGKSDEQAAGEIAAAGIHVLIDLAGHTTGNRLGVLARRPAPLQLHYLGYPGTTGATYIDYFITDHVATPPEFSAEFTEQLAYLPRCFMVSNGVDAKSAGDAARAEQGLPQQAFVFCSFTNSSRITRDVFAQWMEILRAVPSSVLWLKQSHALTVKNLRTEAQSCGIDPERLIFAQRISGKPAHLARLGLADLALDTIGWYNGHSNTSDMLWAGVPVLTAPGVTFASRVAASLLHAAGLPELVARDAQEYLKIAIQLGRDHVQCSALRRKLAENKRSAPFFDQQRIVTDLEAAYREMWRMHRAGDAPHAIHVAEIDTN